MVEWLDIWVSGKVVVLKSSTQVFVKSLLLFFVKRFREFGYRYFSDVLVSEWLNG